jgi:arylsulfatase A-like enzyme
MRWPGKIPAGSTCNQIAGNIDILPTFAKLAGVPLPNDRVFDGRDISSLMFNANAPAVRDTHLYLSGMNVAAIRQGDWKLFLKAPKEEAKGNKQAKEDTTVKKKKGEGPVVSLFNLTMDPGETNDVAEQNPDVVARLIKEATIRSNELETNKRPAGLSDNTRG